MAENHSLSQSLSLIVRVKRKREYEATEAICIIESEQDSSKRPKYRTKGQNGNSHRPLSQFGLTEMVSKLDTSLERLTENERENESQQTKKRERGRLILHRINTVTDPNQVNGEIVETQEESLSKKRMLSFPEANQFIVTSRSRITNDSNNIFMVDMAHISSKGWEQSQPLPTPPKKGARILDPATRALQAAFDLKNPDEIIEQIILSIEQGADINSQRKHDGLTALMVATRLSSVRLVSKLIQKGANVFLQNQDAQSAIDFADYADVENRSDASKQVSFLLRHAASNQYAASMTVSVPPIEPPKKHSESNEDDYVYDIYMIDKTKLLSTLPNDDDDMVQQSERDVPLMTQAGPLPTVEVPGIKIVGGEISGETTFYYDSDWSDLADDEDPDSNDEKFFGNDYPEEENDEDDWNNDQQDPDETEGGLNGCFDDFGGDSEDETPQRRWKPDIDCDGDDEDDDKMPKFDRKGIGRVLEPFIVGGPNGTSSSEKIDVDALWSLRPDQTEGEDMMQEIDPAHQTRKDDMARRTGMMVGSSQREFQKNGIAKYGMDLSDDESDLHWVASQSDDRASRAQHYNYEAYDSEQDHSN